LGLLLPPGAGKTSMVYMLIKVLMAQGFIKRALVICPVRPMLRVWPHQKDRFAEFADLRVNVLHGKDKEQQLVEDDVDISVINPEGLAWLFAADKDMKPDPVRMKWLASRYDMLVVDESTKFKNSQSNRFKLLKALVPKFKRRYILTGTPTPKGLMDLFGQVYILDEGQSLGRYITHFRTKYFFPSGYGGYDWQLMPDGEQRILDAVAPLVFRRDLKDAEIDLPEIVWDDIWVDLPPAAMKLYRQMEDDMVARMDEGSVVAENGAVASGKCRQIANGNLIDTETGEWRKVHAEKVDALVELIEQLQGEPCLVTYEFKSDAADIMAALKCPNISSGSAKKDDKNIEHFSRGLLPVVIGNPASIALGIDGLQDSCCHIAMVGCTWKLQDYIQVIDRIRRQGSKSKRVWVHRILARHTLDERMVKVLEQREATQDNFMDLLKAMRKQ
jgi:SNF2 family DNA or RNA helicase